MKITAGKFAELVAIGTKHQLETEGTKVTRARVEEESDTILVVFKFGEQEFVATINEM